MMRVFIYTIIFCCITSSIFAQSDDIEVTIRENFFSNSSKILPLDNGETIIVGNEYLSGGWRSFLRLDKIDASGNLIWTKTYPQYNAFSYVTDAIVGSDNSVYILFERFECDIFLEGMLVKIDSDGNAQWNQEIDLIFTLNIGFNVLRANQNGGFWVSSSNELIEYDGDYNIIQTIPLSAKILNFDYDTSTEDFVICHTDPKKLIYLEASGDTREIDLLTCPKVHFQGEHILARYSDKIERYDKQLNLVNSIELPRVYSEFEFSDNNVYLYDDAHDAPNEILKLNENLEIVGSTTWHRHISDISAGEDYLYISGTEYHHTYFKVINDDFTYTDTNTDIGVIDILINEADSTCYSPSEDCGIFNYDIRGIKAVVKNFGTETINYFELNAFFDVLLFSICYDPQAVMTIHDNVYIPPGGIDTVDFSDLDIRFQREDLRLCLYTTRPSKFIDKNHDNDEVCRSFFYNDIISVEPSEGHFEFSISPNPASDVILLKNTQVDWQKVTVNIINIEGKQIATQQSPQIDISSLPAGVYVVQAQYGGATGSKRFVKYK